MFRLRKFLLFAFTIILTITACGTGTDSQAAIQTAVAETVAAQNANQPIITETPAATLIPTQTPYQLPTSLPTLPATTSASTTNKKVECAHASLQDESIVDGTIFSPGEQFTKTWYVTNTSSCVWDTTYKIVFWDGNVLGGGYVYNLPQVTAPGQTVPISLVLIAPTTDGTYRSEWKLQTPDNINFGVGYLNAAFYADIQVSSAENPVYGVTSVSMVIDREPDYGCQLANTDYWAIVTITTNGPIEFRFRILHSDGGHGSPEIMKFTEAGKVVYSAHRWRVGRANSQNDNRWMQFAIIEPFYKEYEKVGFEFFCP
jgi:hypothetical protein